MLEAIFWVFVGALIGWHFPQPQWARDLTQKVVDFFRSRG